MPIAGAFHHPFQRGPADLFEPDFGQLRSTQFAQRFKDLAALNQRQQQLTERFNEKFGLANPFVHWPAIELPWLLFVVTHTPWPALSAIFHRLLQTRERFAPVSQTSWSFMRPVMNDRGQRPGDRLQTHQTAWLTFLAEQGIQVSVLQIAKTTRNRSPTYE